MDIDQKDLDRQLEQVDAMNRAAMPKWRDVLHRVFSGEERLTVPQKAKLLGVPARRQFLQIGGLGIVGAAVLAACGDDDDTTSGAVGSSTTAGDGGAGGSGNMDIVLANTAISLEALAIKAYETAAASGLVTTPAVGEAAALFMAHHTAHRDALISVVEGAGATPFTDPNPAVQKALVDPAVKAAKSEADIIKLAFDLEGAAAQTYVFAAGELSTPELRSTIMTIGGVERRHAIILGTVGKLGNEATFPAAFIPATNPLPADAVIAS